jgi:hypothetical protein
LSDWPDWSCRTKKDQEQLIKLTSEAVIAKLGKLSAQEVHAMTENRASVQWQEEIQQKSAFEVARHERDIPTLMALMRSHPFLLEYAARLLARKSPGRPEKTSPSDLDLNMGIARRCRKMVREVWKGQYGQGRRTAAQPPSVDTVVAAIMEELEIPLPANWQDR